MKIYTKTGDTGTTGLYAGPRVSKADQRIEAYGSVDELNALLGLAVAWVEPGSVHAGLAEKVSSIQNDLFAIGAELATPEPALHGMCMLTQERTAQLEKWIDDAEEKLPQLRNFVIPGGCTISAALHWARTVCRRAERQIVALATMPNVSDCTRIIVYLNRLSDLFFVWARYHNQLAGVPDVPWNKP